MNNKPFWEELQHSLAIRGINWKNTVSILPDELNEKFAVSQFASNDQLINCNMTGRSYTQGKIVELVVNSEALKEMTFAEEVCLQWLYQFFVVEGVEFELSKLTPNHGEWPVSLLDLLDAKLHTMVYLSSLLCLTEESKNLDEFKERVEEAVKNLYEKTDDYGESFRRHGIRGLIPRLWDKIARYIQLQANDHGANFEPREDSARDLLGYSIVTWSLIKEAKSKLEL